MNDDLLLPDTHAVGLVLEYRSRAMARMEQLETRLEVINAALLAHLIAGGPVSVGDNLYIAADHRKDVRCKDNVKALDAMLKACGGNIEEVGKCLASKPFKHGACRLPLADAWEEHFETIFVPFIKDGVTTKQLVTINKNFIK